MYLISILLTILIFGGYTVYKFLQRNKKLFPVEAGPVDGADRDFTKSVIVNVNDLQMKKSLKYFVVRNDCMIPRHIYSGDVIGVQMFDNQFTIKDVKKDDILLIYLNDEDFKGRKIRVMKEIEGNAFHTYYFRDGKPKDSKKLHAFDTILGVVRETNHPVKAVA